MKTKRLQLALIFLLFISLSNIFAQQTKMVAPGAEPKFPEASAFANSKMICKIIDSPNKTYSYDIIADDRLLIHQPSVPGMPGNEGFKSKQAAEKVGQLVIRKIKNGEMPPTVTKEEMQKLKAL